MGFRLIGFLGSYGDWVYDLGDRGGVLDDDDGGKTSVKSGMIAGGRVDGVVDGVHKVRESIPSPRGWTKTKRAPADHIIELRIALPQPNFGELEKHLDEIRSVLVASHSHPSWP